MRHAPKVSAVALAIVLALASPGWSQPQDGHGGSPRGVENDGGHGGGYHDAERGRDDHGDRGSEFRAGPGADFHGGGDRGRDFHGGPGVGSRGGYDHGGRGYGGPIYHGYGGYGYGGYGGYAGPFAVGAILGYYEGRPYYCYHRHHWRWSARLHRYVPAYDRSC